MVYVNYMLIGKALLDTLLVRSYHFAIDSTDLACDGFTTLVNCPYTKPITLAHLNYKAYVSVTAITYLRNTTPSTNKLKFHLKVVGLSLSAITLNL